MALNLGELSVTLGAILTRFDKSIASAREQVSGLAKEMRGLVNNAGRVAVASAAAGAAIAIGLVKNGLDAVATQYKLANAVGATIDGVKALTLAGDDLGLSTEEVQDGIGKVNQRLGEFIRQGGNGARMLKDLGLSAEQLSRMDADKRLAAIADRVKALGLSSAQAADLARQLGLRGAEWGLLFQQGGDAIRDAREEVDKFGLSISMVDAEQVFAAQDAMEDIGRALANIRDQVAIALAPIIGELAARFNDAAAEAGGFKQQARTAVESSLRGFAKVADVVQGLRVVIKGVQLVLEGFGAAVVSVFQVATEIVVGFVDGIIFAVNKAIDALNKLPKVDIAHVDPFSSSAFVQGLREFADNTRDRVGAVRSELHELAMQEMPSAKVEAFLEAVRVRSEEAAKEVVNARRALRETAGAAGFGVDTSEADKAAEEARKREEARMLAEQQGRMDRVQALRDALATEAQIETDAFYAKLETLYELSETELAQLGGFQAAKEQLEHDHQERMKEIREAAMTDQERFLAMSWDRQVATVAGSIANMTAGVASGNKKMFELNKVAALAQTALDLPAAIIASYRNAGGWPLGAAAAAAMAAAGAAQIAQIKNAKFGGGAGAAPAAASGGGGAGVPRAAAQTITINGLSAGSLFSGSQVRDLLEALQESLNDGGKLVLN